MGDSSRMMRHACFAVCVLVLAMQTLEEAEADAELVQPLAALGVTAKLADGPEAAQDLLSSLQGSDPNLSVEKTKMEVPGSKDPAETTEEKVADPNAEPALSPEAMAAEKEKQAQKAAQLLAAGKVTFNNIPSFMYAEDSKKEFGVSRDECEGQCKADSDCISYSFKASTEECVKSRSCIQYDLEYIMYARKAETVEGAAAFRTLGNMKFMVMNKDDQKVASFPGISESNCAANCGKNPKCVSYAYRHRDEMCLTSAQAIGYSGDWQYYEKAGASILLAQKIKDQVETQRAAPLPGKKDGKDDKAEDEKLKEVDRTSLSSAQLAALQKARPDDNGDLRAVLLDGLKARTAQLTADEKARAAVTAEERKKADEQAVVENALEVKGKAVYKSDIASTKGELDKAVESATKAGWKASEASAKSEEASREATQKETAESQAAKLKAKTTDQISSTATAILEAKDAMTAVNDRLTLFKQARDHYQELDNKEAAKIKQHKQAMAAATATIVMGKDTKKLDELKATVKSHDDNIAAIATLISAKQGMISELNLKIPSLNTQKDAADDDVTNIDVEISGLESAIANVADPGVKSTKEQQLQEAKTKKTDAEAAVQKIVDEQSEISTKIGQATSTIQAKNTEKGQAQIAKNSAQGLVDTEEGRLQGLVNSGNEALQAAKFKSNQALA